MATRLIAVVGPTASGKSALGLRLARDLGGEIVSCDSLQVYRGLDIGSAKPTASDRREVRHHLIDIRDPDEDFSAADYARLAAAAVAETTAAGGLPIVVGGTGLYLRALLRGIFEGPPRDAGLRARFVALADRHGDARVHRLLRHVDATAAGRIDPGDRLRIVRALEVYWSTGRPISEHQREATRPPGVYEVLTIGLSWDREALRARVEARTRWMRDHGLLDEVRGLLGRYPGDLRPLGAIGYRQAVRVIRGEIGEDAAFAEIVSETMRYAKRQRTWFRHQADVRWCDSEAAAHAIALEWGRR